MGFAGAVGLLLKLWVVGNTEKYKKNSMRTYSCWMFLTVAATVAGQLGVTAQDWQTVDDFAPGGANAEAHGVAVDPAGGVYVVGTANGHGMVRYSADGGATWSTRDDSATNGFNAITINRQGDLYVGGASGGHWIVRRSKDQGATWETVDDFFSPMIDPGHPGTNAAVYSLSSDGEGRVYGAGLMRETGPSYPRWWVRGSDGRGTNWDSKLVVFAGYGGVSQLTWAGEDVYVTGKTSDGEVNTGLIVKSSDFGANWTTNFQSTSETYSAITADPGGNIYAAGIVPSSASTNWLVRKAAPGGTNWTIVDQFSAAGGPSSIAVDAARSICVAGSSQFYNIYTDAAGTHYDSNWQWITRQYSAASGQWNTTDVFSYSSNPTNVHAAATGTAIAGDGTTFVVGYGSTESGQHHWIVRKGAAHPRLQIAAGNGSVTVSWPAAYANSLLQWTDSMGANQVWQNSTGSVTKVAGQNTATFNLSSRQRLFRLKSTAGQ